jgi:hypothetical protein
MLLCVLMKLERDKSDCNNFQRYPSSVNITQNCIQYSSGALFDTFIMLTDDHRCRFYQNNKISSSIRYLHSEKYSRQHGSITDQDINLVFKEAYDQVENILYNIFTYFSASQRVSFSVVVQ